MQRRPAPQEYVEYRAYLRDMVAHLKATTKTFSYRAFAQRGGFGSVGFLKHLVNEIWRSSQSTKWRAA